MPLADVVGRLPRDGWQEDGGVLTIQSHTPSESMLGRSLLDNRPWSSSVPPWEDPVKLRPELFGLHWQTW